MAKPIVIREWRPEECGRKLGEIVLNEHGQVVLEVKCRKCSKEQGRDVMHRLMLRDTKVEGCGT